MGGVEQKTALRVTPERAEETAVSKLEHLRTFSATVTATKRLQRRLTETSGSFTPVNRCTLRCTKDKHTIDTHRLTGHFLIPFLSIYIYINNHSILLKLSSAQTKDHGTLHLHSISDFNNFLCDFLFCKNCN